MKTKPELDNIIQELLGNVSIAREKELRAKFMTILTEDEQPKQDNNDHSLPRMF